MDIPRTWKSRKWEQYNFEQSHTFEKHVFEKRRFSEQLDLEISKSWANYCLRFYLYRVSIKIIGRPIPPYDTCAPCLLKQILVVAFTLRKSTAFEKEKESTWSWEKFKRHLKIPRCFSTTYSEISLCSEIFRSCFRKKQLGFIRHQSSQERRC